MKVVVAMDSFKGSLSSVEAGNAVKEGILCADPLAEVIVKPMADGGEGTAEALTEELGGSMRTLRVRGPMGKEVEASYGYLEKRNTAIMEMASASGITLLTEEERNPMEASTIGVGQMIRAAVLEGCRSFIIGIGGSATNDGGTGMLTALGYIFLDKDGREVPLGAQGLSKIERIQDSEVLEGLAECYFQIACDVNNPLCGKNGATYIFGPQKGVKDSQREALDQAMAHFANKTAEFLKVDYSCVEGAGAAGGLGFAFLSYLHGELKPGIEVVREAVGMEEAMQHADYVITGEGRLDGQTAMGKGPAGVAETAKKCSAKVIALAGSLSPEAERCHAKGIDAYFCILPQPMSLAEAMQKEITQENLRRSAEQVFRLIMVK